MGVRSRKRSRNTSRFQINAKKKQIVERKKRNPLLHCQAVKEVWDSKKPAATNMKDMGLIFDLNKVAPPSSQVQVTEPAPISADARIKAKQKARAKKQKQEENVTGVVKQLEEQAYVDTERKSASRVKLTRTQEAYAETMLDLYGQDFNAMARDYRNFFQDTPKQIQAKIKLFTNNPKYYLPYLKSRKRIKRNMIQPIKKTHVVQTPVAQPEEGKRKKPKLSKTVKREKKKQMRLEEANRDLNWKLITKF